MNNTENYNKSIFQRLISRFPSLYILLNKNNSDLKNALTNIKGYKSIKSNYLLDTDYYLKNNADVKRSGLDPVLHYIYHGFKEGRKPNPSFDGKYYLEINSDVKNSNLNPLVHYSLYGIKEGRKIDDTLETQINVLQDKLNEEKSKLELAENKLKDLEEDRAKFSTVPDYGYLKKLALKGNDGYLFLINDSNSEIRQHFDYAYINNFNVPLFIKNLDYKKDYCRTNNINYYFFLTPDKSLICKDFLPFDVKLIKRNYDLISNIIPDFSHNLDHTCYYKNESHMNYFGGKELSYHFLNYIDKDFKREDFEKLVEEQISYINYEHYGDLLAEKNWSYSDEEREEYIHEKGVRFNNKFIVNLNENLPEEFKTVRLRETEHYKNEQGLKNLRVLIFRDSTVNYLKDILAIYFKEILLYWDHWFFNKDLIEWYKPDIILEIRTERFLENMKYEIK
ncbi:hypothetical protein [Methanobacterium oryzae]|uniref:hypothetical protein n=1 Tax=Methanobacterium oryzae TaxID=69540 RepID=UPI003D1B3C90